jgi:hypothetical protein
MLNRRPRGGTTQIVWSPLLDPRAIQRLAPSGGMRYCNATSPSLGRVRYEVLDLEVRALVRANHSVFRAFAEASEDSNFSEFETLRQVVTVARSELSM